MNYFTGSNAYNEARDYLKNHKDHESGSDRIIVENQTKYDLEYVTNGKITGVPVEDVKESFVDKGNYDYAAIRSVNVCEFTKIL